MNRRECEDLMQAEMTRYVERDREHPGDAIPSPARLRAMASKLYKRCRDQMIDEGREPLSDVIYALWTTGHFD